MYPHVFTCDASFYSISFVCGHNPLASHSYCQVDSRGVGFFGCWIPQLLAPMGLKLHPLGHPSGPRIACFLRRRE